MNIRGSGYGQVTGCCDFSNGSLVSMNDVEFFFSPVALWPLVLVAERRLSHKLISSRYVILFCASWLYSVPGVIPAQYP